jgi:putative transposase
MQQARGNSETSVWAYVLMDNHVHIIAVPQREDSLATMIKEAHETYTRYFNTKYGLVGHVWQNRFKSFVMEWNYCLNAVRYVERNPVRAGLVKRAEHYRWSSAAAHCRLRDDILLSNDNAVCETVTNWTEWLNVGNPPEVENTIRKYTGAGRPLGSDAFIAKAQLDTGRILLPKKRGRHRRPEPSNAGNGE